MYIFTRDATTVHRQSIQAMYTCDYAGDEILVSDQEGVEQNTQCMFHALNECSSTMSHNYNGGMCHGMCPPTATDQFVWGAIYDTHGP